MAIQTSLITFKNKIDGVVGQKSFGRWTLRQNTKPRNPKTTKQQAHRQKFALVGGFAGRISAVVNQTFKNSQRTAFSEFIKVNFDNIVGGTAPNYELLYENAVVSRGNLDQPYNPSASVDSGTLSVTWTDNSGIGNALGTDQAAILVYNPSKEQAVYTFDAGKRSDRMASITVPSVWNGDNVEVWFFMKSATESNFFSDSYYLGSLSV